MLSTHTPEPRRPLPLGMQRLDLVGALRRCGSDAAAIALRLAQFDAAHPEIVAAIRAARIKPR